MKKNKGFTLIELLVVIAIIGILASVVLAALGSARTKAADAKIASQLANMRPQAELYTGATTAVPNAVCVTTASDLFGTASNGLGSLIVGFPVINRCYYAGTLLPANGGAWVVAAKTSTGAWCVDSTGYSSDKIKSSGVAYGTVADQAALVTITGSTTCL